MNIYQYKIKKRWSSTLTSLIVHVLLLAIIAYLSYRVYQESSIYRLGDSPAISSRAPNTIPATVSFNTQKEKISPVIPLDAPIIPQIMPADSTTQETLIHAADTEQAQAGEPADETISVPTPETDSGTPATFRPLVYQRTTPNFATAVTKQYSPNNTGQNTSPQSTKPKVTGAVFAQAFRNAYRTGHGKTTQTQAQAYSGSTQAAHIQEHIASWRDANYRLRVMKAIEQASKVYQQFVYFKEDYETEIIIHIAIQPDGKVINIEEQSLTGKAEIDQQLLDIFYKKVTFPPIPKHLKQDIFTLTLPIKISVQKGNNDLRFVCNFNN